MATQQAVFDTYELLENIILQLPGHHIPRLQLVSKSWKDFINSSSALRRHYNHGCLLPARWDGSEAQIPVYDESPNIKFHPILRRSAAVRTQVRKTLPHDVMKWVTIDRRNLELQQFFDAKGDFLTSPPCHYLHIFKLVADEDGHARHIKDGFRISDLLDLAKEQDERLQRLWGGVQLNPKSLLSCGPPLTLTFKEDTTEEAWWKQSMRVEKKAESQQTGS